MNGVKKRVKLDDHARFAGEINELIDRSVILDVDISNTIGKTTALKISSELKKAGDKLSSARWKLENIMLADFPDAPLYTSYRKYRREDAQDPVKKNVEATQTKVKS